jgi:hypothetical protein
MTSGLPSFFGGGLFILGGGVSKGDGVSFEVTGA